MIEDGEFAPVARPGADAGYFMVALAAVRSMGFKDASRLQPAIFDAVIRSLGGAKQFRFHTDEHAAREFQDKPEEQKVARGCGHLRQAEKDPRAYGLEPEDMSAIFGRLSALKKEGASEVVLRGEHRERAVIVVDSPKFGFRRGDGNGFQVFVYHAALDRLRLEKLAGELAKIAELRDISAEVLRGALIAASDREREETLRRLAAGLPIFAVGDEGKPILLGNVSA
jgi:hypothetical protein